jgi:hypothetical protein
MKQLWDMWWTGNRSLEICPLRSLDSEDIVHMSDKARRSKAILCIKTLVATAERLGLCDGPALRSMETTDRDEIFEKTFIHTCSHMFPGLSPEDLDHKRVGEWSYLTFYDYFTNQVRTR